MLKREKEVWFLRIQKKCGSSCLKNIYTCRGQSLSSWLKLLTYKYFPSKSQDSWVPDKPDLFKSTPYAVRRWCKILFIDTYFLSKVRTSKIYYFILLFYWDILKISVQTVLVIYQSAVCL